MTKQFSKVTIDSHIQKVAITWKLFLVFFTLCSVHNVKIDVDNSIDSVCVWNNNCLVTKFIAVPNPI